MQICVGEFNTTYKFLIMNKHHELQGVNFSYLKFQIEVCFLLNLKFIFVIEGHRIRGNREEY